MSRPHSFLILILALLWESNAHASMCINGRKKLDQEFNSSIIVVNGNVRHIKSIIYNNASDPEDIVTVRVDHSYKGSFKRQIIKFSNSRDSAAFPVVLGNNYLMFFHKRNNGNVLYVDTCGSSKSVKNIQKREKAELKILSNYNSR